MLRSGDRAVLGILAATGLASVAVGGCSGSNGPGDDDDSADASVDHGGFDVPVDGAVEDGDGADMREYREYGGETTDATRVVTSASVMLLPDYAPGAGGVWAWLCRCEGPMPPPPTVLAEDGGCRLTHDEYGEPSDPTMCTALDFGEMSVILGGTAYPLQHPESYHPCWFSCGTDMPDLAEGVEVRLTATGGADIPAFDETFTMPPHVALTEPSPRSETEWTIGEPWEVLWDPPRDMVVRLTVPSSGHLWLQCIVPGAPPLVVPATVTAAWDEVDNWGTVNFVATEAVVVPGDAGLRIEVGWGDTASVTFAPPP